jgi:hypothetical protein
MLRHHRIATRLDTLNQAIRDKGVDAVAADVTELKGMVL